MPYKGGVQLFPESQRRVGGATGGGNAYISAGIGLLAVVLVVFLATSAYVRSAQDKIDVVDGQLVTLEGQRQTEQEATLLAAKRQTDLIGKLLDNHIYWTQAFTRIEQLLQGQVAVRSLEASAKRNEIQLTASAATYATIAKQLAAFLSDPNLKDVELGGIRTGNAGTLEFSGVITVAPDVLTKKK